MISFNTVYQWRRVYVRENKSNLCPTLTAFNMGTGGHNVPLVRDKLGIRKLTFIHYRVMENIFCRSFHAKKLKSF